MTLPWQEQTVSRATAHIKVRGQQQAQVNHQNGLKGPTSCWAETEKIEFTSF